MRIRIRKRASSHFACVLRAGVADVDGLRRLNRYENSVQPSGVVMGANRSSVRRIQRLKRHKKLMKRLLAKAEAQAKTAAK